MIVRSTLHGDRARLAGRRGGIALGLALAVLAASASGADATLSRIEALIGAAECRADAECRTLPLGRRACGGPQRLLAWSTRVTDERALLDAGAAHDALGAHAPPGTTASTCIALVDHGAACTRAAAGAPRRCVLRAGSAAAPSAGTH